MSDVKTMLQAASREDAYQIRLAGLAKALWGEAAAKTLWEKHFSGPMPADIERANDERSDQV